MFLGVRMPDVNCQVLRDTGQLHSDARSKDVISAWLGQSRRVIGELVSALVAPDLPLHRHNAFVGHFLFLLCVLIEVARYPLEPDIGALRVPDEVCRHRPEIRISLGDLQVVVFCQCDAFVHDTFAVTDDERLVSRSAKDFEHGPKLGSIVGLAPPI